MGNNYLFKKVSRDSTEQASKQLWDILLPYQDYLDPSDQSIVELAFTQMVIAHGEMRRKSGEYYIIHPVAATITLLELHLDPQTIAAGLLHDVPEDTAVSLKDLQKDFDPEIIFLIEGVTKFGTIKYQGEKRYAENIRKMFVALSKDIRVIFIKLADRIHNLETLEYVRPDKQRRIALESLEIYAPIAERLGMSKLRGIIEDLAFPFVYPAEYKELIARADIELTRRQKVTDKIIEMAQNIFEHVKIPFSSVSGRAKRYYSIYLKTITKQLPVDQLYDLIAVRVITYTVEQCYEILSQIHQNFEQVPDRVKDYILAPKENGYQSIHTTVIWPATGEYFEFQIRTVKMHEYAEYGIASHLGYKAGENIDIDPRQYKWIDEIVQLGKRRWFVKDEDYLRRVKIRLYHDRIFVLSPKGDVFDLKNGATVLDFAFKVHEDIGKTASMAKINGRPTRLDERLKNGDLVEIITNKNQRPTIDWLSKTTTQSARGKILRFLNIFGREPQKRE